MKNWDPPGPRRLSRFAFFALRAKAAAEEAGAGLACSDPAFADCWFCVTIIHAHNTVFTVSIDSCMAAMQEEKQQQEQPGSSAFQLPSRWKVLDMCHMSSRRRGQGVPATTPLSQVSAVQFV